VVQLGRQREHAATIGADSQVPFWESMVMLGTERISEP
jgi:hypothetical protein